MRWRGLLGRGATLANRLVILLIIAGIASGFATYAALTETPPFGLGQDRSTTGVLCPANVRCQ